MDFEEDMRPEEPKEPVPAHTDGQTAGAKDPRAPRAVPWGLGEVLAVVGFSLLLSLLAGGLFSADGFTLCEMALSSVLTALVCVFAFAVAFAVGFVVVFAVGFMPC